MNDKFLDKWLDGEEARRREKLLKQVSEVCAVPASAQRVMALSSDDDADVKKIADAVSADPAIAAQLLKIANSPLFAHSRQITDLKRAVVLIGRKELHSIAVAMAMLAAVKLDTPLSKKLSNSSVLSATFAKVLAIHVGGSDGPTAFLAGLLCEIGALACLSVDPEGYAKMWEKCNGAPEVMVLLEKDRYGITSTEVGVDMLARNLLPEPVIEAIKLGPKDDLAEATPLQRITLFAKLVAPMIVAAAKDQDVDAIRENCVVIADSVGLEGIDPEKLLEMAVLAATAAELRLRGRPID
jgi:HD-like signal output (HDOD) protein